MLVTSIDTTLETGVVPTQIIVIISTVRRQSEVGIQRWIDVGPIINFCLGIKNTILMYRMRNIAIFNISILISYFHYNAA